MRWLCTISGVLFLLPACVPQKGDDSDSDSDSGIISGDPSVGTSSTTFFPTSDGHTATSTPTRPEPDPETGPVPQTTAFPGETGTTDPTGDTEQPAETETEGEVGEPPPDPCAAWCANADACEAIEPIDNCLAGCQGELDVKAGVCLDATVAWLECLAGLTCEQLADLQSGQQPAPCAAEADAKGLACDEGCNVGAGGDFEGNACMLDIDCPGEPHFEMECDTETCVCLTDGAPSGECAALEVCLDLSSIEQKGVECCGFPEVDF